jgi:hypothetical protein
MNEVPTLVTSCINCIAPGSLSATFAVILERQKLARVRTDK